jgi:hypothetical protein
MKTDTSALIGSPKQVAWANNLRIAILKEASELDDSFLAATIPSMLASVTDATIWIAMSSFKRPGMPLPARIVRMNSSQVATLQKIILCHLQQHENLGFVPGMVSPEICEQALAS